MLMLIIAFPVSVPVRHVVRTYNYKMTSKIHTDLLVKNMKLIMYNLKMLKILFWKTYKTLNVVGFQEARVRVPPRLNFYTFTFST